MTRFYQNKLAKLKRYSGNEGFERLLADEKIKKDRKEARYKAIRETLEKNRIPLPK
jgi:hypothetical protein